MTDANSQPALNPWRFRVLVGAMLAMLALVLWKLVSLQVLDSEHGRGFLQDQGDARTLRTETIPAHRGIISDRHGAPLAVSTPVRSIWANPSELLESVEDWAALAERLSMTATALKQRVSANSDREFLYLRRRLAPAEAEAVLALGVQGVYAEREYRRFYPAAEVAAHLVGLTNVDEDGQEGIELAFDDWLQGEPGAKQVLKDRYGNIIRDVKSIRAARPGNDLQLSLDLRLQYLAYRELKKAVIQHRARSGSVVLIDTRSGEVLAVANQPSYNPNRIAEFEPSAMRNRALTDLLEPGSTVKPLTVLAALESGQFTAESVIDTSPGYLRVGRKTFTDFRNYGQLDLTGVLTKSSQVGISKIALTLDQDLLRDVFSRAGLGRATDSGFPGESIGILPGRRRWGLVQQANFAFGYGLSVTPLQLAGVYATLANDGQGRPLSLLKVNQKPVVNSLFDAALVSQIRSMLETVTSEAGTGTAAAIPGYRVAGKTGTVHKVGAHGYAEDRYLSLFAGFAPASRPRLAAVIIIDEPNSGEHFGGAVAAPVFNRVVGNALRLLNIAPDDLGSTVAASEAAGEADDPGQA